MCTTVCEHLLNSYTIVVMEQLKKDEEAFLQQSAECFYSCLREKYREQTRYNYRQYHSDKMLFIADSAFTDAVLTFRRKAIEGKLFDGEARLKTVFYRYFYFTLLAHIKKEKKDLDNTIRMAESTQPQQNNDFQQFNEDRINLLHRALSRLNKKDQEIITWRHLELKPIDEIAQKLAINKDSASNRVYRCMERLKKEIKLLTGK
jgi:RNA polymerase sigma factor (sigma-70 family)